MVWRRARTFLALVVSLAWVATASAQNAAAPNRSDVARSYAAFERAWADYPPTGAERTEIARQFDWMAHQVFRGQYTSAVRDFDEATNRLLPPALTTTAARAARATRVRVEPSVFVQGEATPVALRLDPMYDISARPSRLTVRIAPAETPEAPVFESRFEVAGDGVQWTPGDLPTGRYVVQIATPQGYKAERGEVAIVKQKPSELRKELVARLAALGAKLADESLRPSLRAARDRLQLLQDRPDPEDLTAILSDIHKLTVDLPREVTALEAGRDPYAGRLGDYWRTFHAASGPLLEIPARVYAPASALSAEKPVPLVIALHGAGGDENLFMDGYGAGRLKRLAERHGFILVSPLTYPMMNDARSLATISDTMEALYAIDPGRVYVMGHSLGAITAAAWVRHSGELLAGVALIAGGGLVPAPQATVPMYVAAAEYDRIFQASRLRRLTTTTQAAGVPSAFHLYESAGHVSIVAEALPDALEWLLRQPPRDGDEPE